MTLKCDEIYFVFVLLQAIVAALAPIVAVVVHT